MIKTSRCRLVFVYDDHSDDDHFFAKSGNVSISAPSRKRTATLLTVFLVALPDVVFVGISRVPNLPSEKSPAVPANDSGGEDVRRTVVSGLFQCDLRVLHLR